MWRVLKPILWCSNMFFSGANFGIMAIKSDWLGAMLWTVFGALFGAMLVVDMLYPRRMESSHNG